MGKKLYHVEKRENTKVWRSRKDPTSTDCGSREGGKKTKEKKLPHVEKEGKNISLAMISSKELSSLFKERDFLGSQESGHEKKNSGE
jgi:hypothetical protein